MLQINNKKMEVTKETLNIGKHIINGVLGFDIVINLEFQNDGQKGYLNLSAGYENEENIKKFINRKYRGIPFEEESEINFFEVFDTIKFLDSEIDSEIILDIGEFKDDKIEASIHVDDELIKIEYHGNLTYLKSIDN